MRSMLSLPMGLLPVVLLPISGASGQADDFETRLQKHQVPAPLAPDAATGDWKRFLGPSGNAVSPETHLLQDWPEKGPSRIWELAKGASYTAPAISGDRLVYFHRLGDQETVDCLHPETAEHYWTFAYPVDYKDRFGYGGGPRASPVIDGGRVYTSGVTGLLNCFDLKTGRPLWRKNLAADYGAPTNFFGAGSTPVIYRGKLIHNVGGREGANSGASVVAFDKKTGREKWVHNDAWGASYASPIIATFHGKDVLLVFAGGESDPANGGLLILNPETGLLHGRFPWRADIKFSVNASTPVVLPGNRVLISETYEKGGVLLEFDKDMNSRIVWKSEALKNHWVTPVVDGGHIYTFVGRNEPDAVLACFNAETGEEMWRKDITWKTQLFGQDYTLSFWRGSLLKADGAFLVLGEFGTLAWMDLRPKGFDVLKHAQLFHARETWTLPVLSRGLLYVAQNERDMTDNSSSKLICYDLRGTTSHMPPVAEVEKEGPEKKEADGAGEIETSDMP